MPEHPLPQEVRARFYILALLAIAALALFSYAPGCGLIYDGGMYASLAKSIYSHGEYTYNGVRGDLPPAFPILLAMTMPLGDGGVDYVAPVAAILMTAVAFLLLRRSFSGPTAFLGALLLLSNPAVFQYSVTVVRDIPLLLFLFLAYLLYAGGLTPGKAVLTGLSSGIAVLTSYPAILYLLPIYAHALYRRERAILLAIASAALLIVPWALWSQANFGTPLVEHSSYLMKQIDLGKNLRYFYNVSLPTFLLFFPVPSLAAVLGIGMEARARRLGFLRDRYLQLLLLVMVPNSVWPEQTIRYLFPALIPVLYFALRFLSALGRERALLILLVALLFQARLAVGIADEVCPYFTLLEDGGHWFKGNTPEGTKVMAASFYQVNYFSERITYQIPKDRTRMERLAREKGAGYVLLDTYEGTTPPFVWDYFRYQEPLKRFSDPSGEVMIYRLSEPAASPTVTYSTP
ncbi:MAG: glycosyltransferase family 39 protein [Candidatus Hydrothermarchaeota archaeon]